VAKALYGMTLLEKEGIIFSPELIGKAYARGSALYETDETAKKEIHEINRAVYEDRPEWQRLYGFGKQMSLEAFEEVYASLGTEFDRNFFESESVPHGRALIAEVLEKGVFEVSDGAVIYRGEKVGLHTRVFQTKDGVPTYEGKELGLPELKEKLWAHDMSVVVTANEQTEYFKVVQAAFAELRPSLAKKMVHIAHGFLRLPEGKMSSRTGNGVPARELILYAKDQAALLAKDSDTAHAIGVGAIKYAILKQRAGSDTVFDSAQALSLVGDSGPYLQYARVRALSILAQPLSKGALHVPQEPYLLERLLYRFPEIVLRAQEERAPHHVAQFLTEIASVWNRFYAEERIIGDEYEVYKRVLAQAFLITMTKGLILLGIPTPERM
jgi:arginyl-tRNA synthetase